MGCLTKEISLEQYRKREGTRAQLQRVRSKNKKYDISLEELADIRRKLSASEFIVNHRVQTAGMSIDDFTFVCGKVPVDMYVVYRIKDFDRAYALMKTFKGLSVGKRLCDSEVKPYPYGDTGKLGQFFCGTNIIPLTVGNKVYTAEQFINDCWDVIYNHQFNNW